jgi:hypothetical protein
MFALPHRHLSAEDEFLSVCFEAQRKHDSSKNKYIVNDYRGIVIEACHTGSFLRDHRHAASSRERANL